MNDEPERVEPPVSRNDIDALAGKLTEDQRRVLNGIMKKFVSRTTAPGCLTDEEVDFRMGGTE